MNDIDELQTLANTPCVIDDGDGNEYKVSFPDVNQLMVLLGKVKSDLLEATGKLASTMKNSGASQDIIDGVWTKYQTEDEGKSLKNMFLDPTMLNSLMKSCLIKEQPDITEKEMEKLLTVPNVSRITSFFEKLSSVIDIAEDASEKN